MQFRLKLILLICFGIGVQLLTHNQNTFASSGDCLEENYNFAIRDDGSVAMHFPVRVIVDETPLYIDNKTSMVSEFLSFDKSLNVVKVSGNRVQVRDLNSKIPMGWVDRSHILCASRPLKGKTGLEMKFYIRTATSLREKKLTVNAYPTPEIAKCRGKCKQLSRFNGFFIFGEKNNRYLLSDNYLLDESTKLVGWVNKEDGFLWETAFGLRPSEHLTFSEGHEKAGQERSECAYLSIADAIEQKNCMPILGGPRWYTYPDRIPLIARVNHEGKEDSNGNFYKVVLPLAGIGAKKEGRTIRVASELFGEDKGMENIMNMKKIDVFFLIDGTQSMEPYIDVIRGKKGQPGVVQRIMDLFARDETFKGADIRFGFRIYRDTYAGEKELGEGFPLPPNCEEQDLDENVKTFQSKIAKIVTTVNDKDDYPENLFGGIKAAIRDLRTCTERTKLLFVVGDHGYDQKAQTTRGVQPISQAYLSKRLKGLANDKPIVTFFLQTPNYCSKPGAPAECSHAHRLFREQADGLVSDILGPNRIGEKKNYLLLTSDSELSQKIISGLKQFSNMRAINEIVLDLRGGTALVNVIERLKGDGEYKNIPGLFWDMVEKEGCKALGEQCKNRIYDTTLYGYIPISAHILEDVFLTSENVDRWINVLESIGDLSGVSGTELRKAFVQALKVGLENELGKAISDPDETLGDFLERKANLPVRKNSPLFRYNLNQLMDPTRVPICEINRLVTWTHNAKQMLSIVRYGDLRPNPNVSEYPGKCPSGNQIPFIDGDISSGRLGGNKTYRYNHTMQKANVYWVPKEFLP